MKKYQTGGKTPKSVNKLEKKNLTSVDMTGKKVNTTGTAKPKPLGVGQASKASKLDVLVGKSKLQKLLRGGSKGMC
jgi:hypothetical protein